MLARKRANARTSLVVAMSTKVLTRARIALLPYKMFAQKKRVWLDMNEPEVSLKLLDFYLS